MNGWREAAGGTVRRDDVGIGPYAKAGDTLQVRCGGVRTPRRTYCFADLARAAITIFFAVRYAVFDGSAVYNFQPVCPY